MKPFRHSFTALLVLAAPALHAQDARQTCAKMASEDRLGPLTVQQCECNYAVAEQVLDPDIRALLFDAWYTGANNMANVEALKPRNRVRKQLQTMARLSQKNC